MQVQRSGSSTARLLVDSGQPRPPAGYRVDLVTALLGVWFTAGLMVDAWAHNNLTELETFFTPWHALFYSGFAATAGWILWTIWTHVRSGRTGLAAVPAGYGPAVVGLVLFTASAVGDGIWHSVFGIERTLNILFSPTHLGLLAGMAMILTSPLRSAQADPGVPAAPALRRLLPAVLSVSLTSALALLFLQYGNAMAYSADGVVTLFSAGAEGHSDEGASGLAAAIVITSLVLLTPLLVVARRWRPPFGTATIVYLVLAMLCAAVTGFGNVSTILALVAAGVAADLLAAWLRPGPARPVAYRAYAGLVPLTTWALYFAVAAATVGRLPTVTELWTGAPVVAALLGMCLAALLRPAQTGEPARLG